MKEISLTNGYVAMVDDEDFHSLSAFKWFAKPSQSNPEFILARRDVRIDEKRHTTQSMHRVILGLDNPRLLVDHVDGNGLNNQRSNLRQRETIRKIEEIYVPGYKFGWANRDEFREYVEWRINRSYSRPVTVNFDSAKADG